MTAYEGYPTWSATYLPFGQEHNPQPTTNHYKFTGKERDSESGLHYFGARYSASSLGRFKSPDWSSLPATVPYADFGDPQTLNLYSYALNNPVVKTDPDGHQAAESGNIIDRFLKMLKMLWSAHSNAGDEARRSSGQTLPQNDFTIGDVFRSIPSVFSSLFIEWGSLVFSSYRSVCCAVIHKWYMDTLLQIY